MDNNQVTINKKKYILMVDIFTPITEDLKQRAYEKIGCIIKGVKQIHKGGLLEDPVAIIEIYVPENKLNEFNKIRG